MRALVLNDGALRVDDVPDPAPGPGQVLARVHACAICASDMHMVHHSHALAEFNSSIGGPFDFNPMVDLVLGHELCAEIIDHGPETSGMVPVGRHVASMAMIMRPDGMDILGYSNRSPGGFGEYVVLSESSLVPVPDGVEPDLGALIEPLSVGMAYRRAAAIRPDETAMVVGCGAIGLATVAAIRANGDGPVIAADFSPARRALAEAMGADEVVDPAHEPTFQAWERLARASGRRGCVVIECVGKPGVLDGILHEIPFFGRVVVAGQNLEPDTVFTAAAHTKFVNVQFGALQERVDFEGAATAIADGSIDAASWLTGSAGLDDAVQAMWDSEDAERHTRILIKPHG